MAGCTQQYSIVIGGERAIGVGWEKVGDGYAAFGTPKGGARNGEEGIAEGLTTAELI